MNASVYESIADLPPGLLPSAAAAGIALVVLHAWLSRRNPAWLGALVPGVYVLLAVGLSFQAAPTGGRLAGYAACLGALLVIWWAGEDEREKRRAHGSAPEA